MAKIKSHWLTFQNKNPDGSISHEIGYPIAHADSTYYENEKVENGNEGEVRRVTVFEKIADLWESVIFRTKSGTANDKIKLNSYIKQGNHYFNITVVNGIENAPVSGMTGIVMLEVLAAKKNNYCKQILYKVGASSTTYHPIYIRTCCAGAWTAWDELVTTNSLTTSASAVITFTGQSNMEIAKDYYLQPASDAKSTDLLHYANAKNNSIDLKRDGFYAIAARGWFAETPGKGADPGVYKKGYLRISAEVSKDAGMKWDSLATAKIPVYGTEIYDTCVCPTVQFRRLRAGDKLRIVATQRGFPKISMKNSFLDVTYLGA